jgi:hypothetical protein
VTGATRGIGTAEKGGDSMRRIIAATCVAATLALAGASAGSAEDAPPQSTPPCYSGIANAYYNTLSTPGNAAVFIALERCKGYL